MAAERIIKDVIAEGNFLSFVELLVKVDASGFMGREYPIKGLRDILKVLDSEGYAYDRATGLILENTRGQITPSWGRLTEGEEELIAVIRLDVVGNSLLVKKNDKQAVESAFESLRNIVNRAVLTRMGRVWCWEGDGMLAAFLFGQKERSAVLAGMEIMHELFWFNRLSNPLAEPLRVRVAAHSGPIRYSEQPMELLKNETLKEAIQIESGTPPDTLSASYNLFVPIDRVIQDRFQSERGSGGNKIKHYAVTLEQS
jgi:hypothetical protein